MLLKEIIEHAINYYIILDKMAYMSVSQGERLAVTSGNVQGPHGNKGFVCYWIEKSNVDQWHPLTLASASESPNVSIILAESRPRPGKKLQKLPGEEENQ